VILIAGPCVLESFDNVLKIAEALYPFSEDCITRSSILKLVLIRANRTKSKIHIEAWT